MRRPRPGVLGDIILVERKLAPGDDATRERLDALLLGLKPPGVTPRVVSMSGGGDVAIKPPAEAGDVQPAPEPEPDPVRSPWRGRLAAILVVAARTVWPLVSLLSVLGTFVGFLLVSRGSGVPVLAAIVATIATAALIAYLGWRLVAPVPSELTQPVFEARAGTPVAPPLAPGSLGADLPVEPLLERRWATGILTAALATETRNGPLDLHRLVDELARLRIPTRLPRRTRWSLDAGAQVIVDFSEDMFALRDDVFWILNRLPRVLGEDRMTILRCAGRPLTAIGPGPRATWGPYTPPTVRQPVLLITNFGVSVRGGFAEADQAHAEWVTLATALAGRGCPVVALVPNEAARVPPELRRLLAVVEWDWTTTASSARRAVHR